MVRLAVGNIVFNDRRSLFRMLSTVAEAHYVFVVDGKFDDYDYHSKLSDDGTRDIVEQFDNTVLIDCPGTEVQKRNAYIQACREHNIDYLLIIDSDEYVIQADWNEFYNNLCNLEAQSDILGIQCKYDGINYGVYPRLWKNPGNWEYHRCHNIFKHRHNGQLIRSPSISQVVDGVKLAWDVTLREPEHERKISEYQTKMMAYEKPIKRELFG